MCIEDEHFISELYARALRRAGYDVTTLVSGDDGLRAAQNDNYDIIMLDLMIPGMTGFEVLRELNKHQPKLKAKIIITTNLDQDETSKEEIEKMEKFSQQSNQDTWGMVTQHQEQSQYDDYVVVIGESVRKDYLHLYGYPVANTPFLSHVNGTFIDGLKSADRYTIPSLTRMLTKTDPKNQTAQYDKNIVSLANKAGFETHWLSNQGSFGNDDTPIAAIARQAHERTFLKHGSYDIALISDMELLGFLKQKLQIPSVKKRLFFIHTVGSHPDACQQIQDFTSGIAVKNASYKGVECYVNSIHKTDVFLQKIYTELRSNEQKSRRSFSMLYFADHGLVAVEEEGKFKLVHGESLQSSDVPLVKISSDDQERKRITSAKSGYYFADGLARWLGISGAELTQYDLFSDEETEQVVFPVFQKSFDNPAIDITDK